MAGFLYYVPSTEKAIVRNDLIGIDFPWYDNAQLPGRHVIQGGPDGGAGFMFRLHGQTSELAQAPVVGMFKDTQKWQCAGKYWIGWQTASPPKPVDLTRGIYTNGHPVKMLDGEMWMIPPVRQANGNSTLPQVWGLDGEGNNCCMPAPEHALLWEKAMVLFAFYTGDEDAAKTMDMTYEGSMAIAGKAIAVNYFMGEKELRARRMCGDDQIQLIGQAIVDMPTFHKMAEEEASAKKKRSEQDLLEEVRTDPVVEGIKTVA